MNNSCLHSITYQLLPVSVDLFPVNSRNNGLLEVEAFNSAVFKVSSNAEGVVRTIFSMADVIDVVTLKLKKRRLRGSDLFVIQKDRLTNIVLTITRTEMSCIHFKFLGSLNSFDHSHGDWQSESEFGNFGKKI